MEFEWTDIDPVADLLPSTGWLGKYMEFTQGLQACARFRFFSAACVLGSIVNNKVYLQRGDEGLLPRLFPNPWIILLGPPGQGNKTSTINQAVDIAVEASVTLKVLSDKLTPESLVKALSDVQTTVKISDAEKITIPRLDAVGLIKAPEASVLFGKQQYNVGMVSLITDLYDYRKEWSSETIMRGRNVLRNICLSIIAGSTPDWLRSMFPQDAFTGGFVSRFILVEMPPTYLKRIGWPKSPDSVGRKDLISDLAGMESLKGEMLWGDGCRGKYIASYENLRPTGDKQIDAYKGRYVEHVLKLGMVLAVSEKNMTLEIHHYETAEKVLDTLMTEVMPRIEFLTTHPRMSLSHEVTNLLRRFPKMSERELLRRLYKSLEHGEAQFYESLRVLTRAGIIKQTGGKPSNYIYELTKRKND